MIALLPVYMLFLLCLVPLIARQPTQYQEHTDILFLFLGCGNHHNLCDSPAASLHVVPALSGPVNCPTTNTVSGTYWHLVFTDIMFLHVFPGCDNHHHLSKCCSYSVWTRWLPDDQHGIRNIQTSCFYFYVEVIIIICVIAPLLIYMLFLLCLDRLIAWWLTQYQKHTDVMFLFLGCSNHHHLCDGSAAGVHVVPALSGPSDCPTTSTVSGTYWRGGDQFGNT